MTQSHEYPNKKEILAERPDNLGPAKQCLQDWKKRWYRGWKAKTTEAQLAEILDLLFDLGTVYSLPLSFNRYSDRYAFYPDAKLITFDQHRPSIISALHEFGHALNGPSELQACRFSVWLFKEVFPEAYAKLTWEGHMLKKKPQWQIETSIRISSDEEEED